MADMQWPPDKDTHVRFLLEACKRVFSYKRLLHVIGTMCNVAVRPKAELLIDMLILGRSMPWNIAAP